MNSRLPVLSNDNPCRECDPSTNCCNPVPIAFGQQVPYPLPYNHPLQSANAMNVLAMRGNVLHTLDHLAREQIQRLPERFRGNRFIMNPIAPSHNGRDIFVYSVDGLATVISDITFLADCSSHDPDTGFCNDYETRPIFCEAYSPETCGRSAITTVPKERMLAHLEQTIAISRVGIQETMNAYDQWLLNPQGPHGESIKLISK